MNMNVLLCLGFFIRKNLQVLLKSFVNNYIKLLLEGMGSHRSQFSKYSLRKFMNNLNMYGLCIDICYCFQIF